MTDRFLFLYRDWLHPDDPIFREGTTSAMKRARYIQKGPGCVALPRSGLWAPAFLALIFICMTVPGECSQATGSLWSGAGSLFTHTRAGNIGDLVTVVIVEKTQASQGAQTTTGKDASTSAGPGGGFGLLQSVVPLLKAGQQDSLSAGGTTTRGGSLSAKMTAQVVDVFPNGNLLIEGRQTIVVNGEEQEILLSGMVRPQDIGPDNVVMSTYIANARIAYRGTGSLGDKQEPGLLSRILNLFF